MEQLNFLVSGFQTADDIRKMSVVEVSNSESFDDLGHAIKHGLYDPLMGPVGNNKCSTCLMKIDKCPGHFGHVELPLPVFHLHFQQQVIDIIQMTCLNCNKFHSSAILNAQLDLLHLKYVPGAQQLADCGEEQSLRQAYLNEFQEKLKAAKCCDCGQSSDQFQIIYSVKCGGAEEEEVPKKKRKIISRNQNFNPNRARDHLRKLWELDQDLLCYLCPVLFPIKSSMNPTDNFFLEVIPVIPNKFRPVSFLEGNITENEHSVMLREVVLNAYVVKLIVNGNRLIRHLKGSSDREKIKNAWQQLQDSVDILVNGTKDKSAPITVV